MCLPTSFSENYEKVLEAVHAYLNLLRSSHLSERTQEELKSIYDTSFRFSEKSSPDSYVTRLSENLGKPYAREDILCGSKVGCFLCFLFSC